MDKPKNTDDQPSHSKKKLSSGKKPSSNEKPVPPNEKPSSSKRPSTDEKPSSSKKPSMDETSSSKEKPSSNEKPSLNGKPSSRKRPSPNEDSMTCFVHNVSPLKTSATGTEYFDLLLQTDNHQSKVSLCFSPTKRRRIDEAMVSKSPIKIAKFNISRNKVFINDKSEIKPCDPDTVDFQYNDELTADNVVFLKDLRQFANGQLVNVKANVYKIGDIEDYHAHRGTIQKREVILRDDQICLKLTLYGDDTKAELEEGECYKFMNVRLNITRDTMYLNTTLSKPFEYETTKEMDGFDLADGATCQSQSKFIGHIVGVSSIDINHVCPACNRKCTLTESLLRCDHCETMLKIPLCESRWFVKIMVKDLASKEVYKLAFPNDQVKQLCETLNHERATEEMFVKRLFEVTEPLIIEFDVVKKIVRSVKLAILQ